MNWNHARFTWSAIFFILIGMLLANHIAEFLGKASESAATAACTQKSLNDDYLPELLDT